MKLHAKSVIAAVATVAITAGTLVLGASSASAATTPPYEPDAQSLGSITLYDSSGNPVYGGSTLTSPIAAYAVAGGTTADSGATQFAHLAIAAPNSQPDTTLYSSEAISSDTNYPVSGAGVPAAVSGAGASTPVVTGAATDLSVATFLGDFTNSAGSASPYYQLYQVRLYTPSTSASTPAATYFSIDIRVDTATNTWTQVYPAPPATTSWSTVTATPVSPADHGSSVTLSATLSASDSTHPAGTATWYDGATALVGGTFTASTGAASISLTPTDGTHDYSVKFTPSASGYVGATSAHLSYVVNAQGSVAVGLVVNPVSGPAYQLTTLTATVNPTPAGAPAGTMQFFDGATSLGTIHHNSGVGNTYLFTQAAGFATGSHSFTATFTPDSTNAWGTPGTSAAVPADYSAPASLPDQQTFQVTVDPGTLTISTPYYAGHPFDLGHMTLSADGTHLSATKAFGDRSGSAATHTVTGDVAVGDTSITVGAAGDVRVGEQVVVRGFPTSSPAFPSSTIVTGVAGNVVTVSQAALAAVSGTAGTLVDFYGDGGVTITDTRNGDQPWTASVTSSDFTSGTSSIDAQNLSFTDVTPVYVTGNALNAATKPVLANDLPSSAGTASNLNGYSSTNPGTGTDGLAGAAKSFASAAHGAGTVYVDGTMTLVAPTSTLAGTYTATVTFTIA